MELNIISVAILFWTVQFLKEKTEILGSSPHFTLDPQQKSSHCTRQVNSAFWH